MSIEAKGRGLLRLLGPAALAASLLHAGGSAAEPQGAVPAAPQRAAAPAAPRRATPAAPEAPTKGGPARRVLALTVKEAILRALHNNPDLEIQRIGIAIASVGIDAARGEFDPLLFLNGSWSGNRDPFYSAPIPGTEITIGGLPPGLQTSQASVKAAEAGVRTKLITGTQVEAKYATERRTSESIFALSPQYAPVATVSLTQPLLRGSGIDVNRAYITIAERSHQASREAFREQVIATALNVEVAYWDYVFALENLKVAEQALATAEDLLAKNRTEFAFGRVAAIEVLVAETGVATRKEAVITARNEIENARDRLMRLISPSRSSNEWDIDLVALDAPRVVDSPVDFQRSYRTALERRPDYRQLLLALEADAVREEQARNGRLPRLDLVGSYSQLGLGNSCDNSFDALTGGRFYDWSFGFVFEFPIFDTTPLATLEQARLALKQDRKKLESLEMQIALEVRTSARNVSAARERITATEVAVRLAEQQLENERQRQQAGLATNHDVLLFVDELTAARKNALKARVDHQVARARLAQVTATLLEQREISIE